MPSGNLHLQPVMAGFVASVLFHGFGSNINLSYSVQTLLI